MAITCEQLLALLPSYVNTVLECSALERDGGEKGSGPIAFFEADAGEVPSQVDGLFLDATGLDAAELAKKIRPLRLKVTGDGPLFCADDCETRTFSETLEQLSKLGLGMYKGWQRDRRTDSWTELEHSPEPGRGPYLFRYQRNQYDPVAQARRYLREMNVVVALEILQDVPNHWLQTNEARGEHAVAFLLALLTQNRLSHGTRNFEHLTAALYQYNRACTWIPANHTIYTCMAAFWRDAGRPDLGRRLLETVQTIAPDPSIERELASFPADMVDFDTPAYPPLQPAPPLRILFLCHPESDFGSDVLHDGLRRVLGPENVVGYPYKPVLHGGDVTDAAGYPCAFNWPDPPTPLDEIARQAAEGGFDVILYSDTLGSLPKDETAVLLEAAGDTPLFVVDMWDECSDSLERICRRDGLKEPAGYFKREMLQGMPYPDNTWPLLFSYPDDRLPETLTWDDRDGVFWTGKLIGGARRLQLSWIEKALPLAGEYGTPYTPEVYAKKLQQFLMGISLPGNGFDTVRYWELPAHGTLLLAERPPLAIPHAFEDGKHAVLFETVSELKEKADYYLAHRDEAIAIAQAGHAHLREYHTGTARAKQCIAVIRERLKQLRIAQTH